jgi:hypothetical protein
MVLLFMIDFRPWDSYPALYPYTREKLFFNHELPNRSPAMNPTQPPWRTLPNTVMRSAKSERVGWVRGRVVPSVLKYQFADGPNAKDSRELSLVSISALSLIC